MVETERKRIAHDLLKEVRRLMREIKASKARLAGTLKRRLSDVFYRHLITDQQPR